MMKVFFVLILLTNSVVFQAQQLNRCEKAIQNGKFNILDRQFKKHVRKHRKGELIQNGQTSYTVHSKNIDTLISWFNSIAGVEKVISDRCMNKIALFPGWTSIAVHLKAANGIVERVYTIQEGKVLNRPLKSLIFRRGFERNSLIYKSARADSTFFSLAKFECIKNEMYSKASFLSLSLLEKKWKNEITSEFFSFEKDSTHELHLLRYKDEVYYFSYPGYDQSIKGYGTNITGDAICLLEFQESTKQLVFTLIRRDQTTRIENFFFE